MSEVYKHLSNIYATDTATLAVICVLCLAAAWIIKEYLANPILVIFVFPVLALMSVLVYYGFITAELFPPRKLDQWMMWTIFATICGNVIGIMICALVSRIRESLRRPFSKEPTVQSRV